MKNLALIFLLGFFVCVIGLVACSKKNESSFEKLAKATAQNKSADLSASGGKENVASSSSLDFPALPQKKEAVPVVAPVPTPSVSQSSDELVIADFNSAAKPNNAGGDFGAWNKSETDSTQGCSMSFEDDDALKDGAGHSLRLDYDVDSENPAYNGFWMKLNGLNASAYNTVSLYLRGEGFRNYTKRIKIEIKDSNMVIAPYIVSGITDRWQKIEIPFERFRKIKDWSSMGEFVLVFDDMNSEPKQGTILVDQIAFKKK